MIRKTKPNIVVLELCKNRMHILDYDEKRLLEEMESLGLAKLRATIKEVRRAHHLTPKLKNIIYFPLFIVWSSPRAFDYLSSQFKCSDDQTDGNVPWRGIQSSLQRGRLKLTIWIEIKRKSFISNF